MENQTRATCWSVTINNPTSADEEGIALARQKGWKVEGQLEKGKEGTPHYQLMVKTPQVRFSALKKQFPRAHIEVTRNAEALANYVTKEETREGELPTSQDKYPSLSKFWDLIYENWTNKNWVDWTEGTPSGIWKDAPINDPLGLLDMACVDLIEEGYHVETIAVNPQTRSAWSKFWLAILTRSFKNQKVSIPTIQNAPSPSSPSVSSSS